MAVFCGPSGNKFLFSNENRLLTSWLPLSMRKALVFPSFVGNTKENIGALQRSFMHEILKPEALKHYIPVMDSMAKSHIEEKWLFDPFHSVISGLISMPIDLPGTAYNRAIKAGEIIRNELLSIIRQREKELSENKDLGSNNKLDLLSRMILAVDEENDKLMNEMEISNNIIGLLVATYETTSSSLTMVLNYLAELPHIYQEFLREQMEIAKSKGPGGGELLSWEDIEKMKYSWNVAREAMRLSPPAQVYSTHKNPKYFPEPEKFDPSRFEGSGPAPFTYVPFGGGPLMCPGREHARLEILVFPHNVVTKFKMEKAIPNEKILYHFSPNRTKDALVRLQPHEN
ncbi:hypothetical protein Vadar_006816 [Vaccinium darrowii]|uniref:Uncharacterized protein n=1 Tax=Vaccinium darrowii TaxID=229202 RepID=A0ACB7WYK7_9ERIC|nr:hypothetical protein Vadar_006816 [Vaccinium darrowii]